jgi:hypothetical protein
MFLCFFALFRFLESRSEHQHALWECVRFLHRRSLGWAVQLAARSKHNVSSATPVYGWDAFCCCYLDL